MTAPGNDLKFCFESCEGCPVVAAIDLEALAAEPLAVDGISHLVIGLREMRAETRAEWKSRGVRFQGMLTPINARDGELREMFFAANRYRLGNTVPEEVTDDELFAAWRQCVACDAPFDITVTRQG